MEREKVSLIKQLRYLLCAVLIQNYYKNPEVFSCNGHSFGRFTRHHINLEVVLQTTLLPQVLTKLREMQSNDFIFFKKNSLQRSEKK